MRLTLEEVASRLGRAIPAEYESFVRIKGIDTLHASQAAPAEICARNLEERALNESGPTSLGFVLCGRGDGDSFVLPDGVTDGLALVWSHESRGLTESAVPARELLEELASTPIPEVLLESGDYVLSRVEPASQAVLDPVTPHQLQEAARALGRLEYFDELQGENPFTREPFRIKASGLALAGREARLDLSAGALMTRNCGVDELDLVARLADYLGCFVLPTLPPSVTAKDRGRGPAA